MKTISKTLYYKEYSSFLAWGTKPEHKARSYVKIQFHFDFEDGLRFSVSAPNISCCDKNPFKAIMRILEHESIGMAKYDHLKDDTRRLGLWQKL